MKEEIKKLVESLVDMYKLFGDDVVIPYMEKEVEKIIKKYSR